MAKTRNLVLVLGDQLDAGAPIFDAFDAKRDTVWMAEVAEEAEHVWSTKPRIAVFLASMRHFRDTLREAGYPVEYAELDGRRKTDSFDSRLAADLRRLRPEKVLLTRPGEWRVWQKIETVCAEAGVPAEMREDAHFYTTPADFAEHARGRKSLRMEFFYREVRKRFGVLMDGDAPAGGEWNYDADNRESFGRDGPGATPDGPGFRPDATTREVIELVNRRFAEHPGSLDSFAWAVCRKDAEKALDDFIQNRLPVFGRYQDAMWTDEPWLYHSLLSACLNLKLLRPREVVDAAEAAYRSGRAPLAAAEGFIRQILGWREYVRGIYWNYMPDYKTRNAMGADGPLPDFYWTGDTGLECLRQAIGQTLEHGYAHHIQRLMVTGLYALLLGVDPEKVHEWYLAVYVDAVEWVELPNTLGMSQYGDGGLMASKPYVATGQYVNRMSNYCRHCPKNPKQKTGADACPFTTLYWDYLLRHETSLKQNRRMALQVRNLSRLGADERKAVRDQAESIRKHPAVCEAGAANG